MHQTRFLLILLLVLLAPTVLAGSPDRLVIHEWGTFTSLQNEAGESLGAINVDDEPVPDFVHRLGSLVSRLRDDSLIFFSQGAPYLHPQVTMRLETPVVYFYPPKGFNEKISFSASFRGGWLTEYYPTAASEGPGYPKDLSEKTMGRITWNNVSFTDTKPDKQTDEHVWLAPRRVKAASVSVGDGEVEKYLFYRGVGHIDSPVRVRRYGNDAFGIYSQLPDQLQKHEGLKVKKLWLVHIDQKHRVGFRTLDPIVLQGNKTIELASTPATFAERDYRKRNLKALRREMKAALVEDGLYQDEAEAMLETWKLSYFQSPGLRLFFMVPRAWTDHILPLEVSVASDIERVMVGRIELVSPGQRALLKRIRESERPDIEALGKAVYGEYERVFKENGSKAADRVFRTPLPELAKQLGFELSPAIHYYLGLGRFRDALMRDEYRRHPDDKLRFWGAGR